MQVEDFQQIDFYAEKSVLLVVVNQKSEDATEAQVREAQWEIVRRANHHQAANLLIDLRDLLFPVTPQLQE